MIFRKFIVGSIIGAMIMYAWINHAPQWMGKGSGWAGDAASGYRGDAKHREAQKVLR